MATVCMGYFVVEDPIMEVPCQGCLWEVFWWKRAMRCISDARVGCEWGNTRRQECKWWGNTDCVRCNRGRNDGV